MTEKKLTAIIIDDESYARVLLRGMLNEYCPQVEILADESDLAGAVKAINKHKPDVVFLDIEMPGHSGLELLNYFNEEEVNFSIIFTTAYQHYAIKAFKLAAIDYLLKPLEPAELEAAVARVEKSKLHSSQGSETKQSAANFGQDTIAIPTHNSVRFIPLNSIIYLKADNSYSEIFLEGNEMLIASRTLRNFEDALDGDPRFFRCHKSFMVHLSKVKELVKSDGGYILMTNDHQVSITPKGMKDLLEMNLSVKR
jgi:two-component system, LytTR family, response regulator